MVSAKAPVPTVRTALLSIPVSVTPVTGQALLAHVLGRDRVWLFTHPEAALMPNQAERFAGLLGRAAQGEPLAYLTGEREFCGLSFEITPDALIPRPETEGLVEAALRWAETAPTGSPRIVDVGTGSGAIAVTLAVKLPPARLIGVDISPQALKLARRNARRHGVGDRAACVRGDLLATLPGPFDAIIANLPYIPRDHLASLAVSRWEPALVLDGGPDGLDLLRRLIDQARTRLAPGSLLALEIQNDQGEAVTALCRTAFPDSEVALHRDLAGMDRIVCVSGPLIS